MEENNINTEPIKKKRGNPNFVKNHKNEHINKDKTTTMSEESTTSIEEKEVKTENTSSESTNTDLPKDIFSDVMPKEEVLPLDGEVTKKDYANINVDPTKQSTDNSSSTNTSTTDPGQPTTNTPPIQTPITPEEQQSQAAQTVSLMLKGYEKLHALGRYMGKVDQQELMTLHAKGKIDLNADLPLGNKTIQVKDFFNEYNQGIDENITVSDDFVKEVTPPLTRICIKHKLFLSDEMYVGMIVAEDLATKVSILIGLKKSANLVLEAVTQMKSASTKSTTSNSNNEDTSSADAWREPEIVDAQPVN